MNKVKSSYFLRKPYKFENHSVEKLFKTIAKDSNKILNLRF